MRVIAENLVPILFMGENLFQIFLNFRKHLNIHCVGFKICFQRNNCDSYIIDWPLIYRNLHLALGLVIEKCLAL